MLLWLFGSPIFLHTCCAITVGFLGIDLQPNRLLFLILAAVLLLVELRRYYVQTIGESPSAPPSPAYEKWLIVYIFAVILGLAINVSTVGSRTVIADIQNTTLFALVYFCSKRFMSEDDFNQVKKAVLVFAVISGLVALYQFFVNPEFFRLGAVRTAFLGYSRANGILTEEYDQGMFMIMALVIIVSSGFSRWIKLSLAGFAFVGIFLTMHRLSWLILAITLSLIWLLYVRKRVALNIMSVLIFAAVGITIMIVPWDQISQSRLVTDFLGHRVLDNTLSGRFTYYNFALFMMEKFPFGIGGYLTSFYNQQAYNMGMPMLNNQALIIHDGFLSAGVKYGWLGFISFTFFAILSFMYFLIKALKEGSGWYAPCLIALAFLLYNTTQDFSFIGSQINIMMAWFLGSYVSVIRMKHAAPSPAYKLEIQKVPA